MKSILTYDMHNYTAASSPNNAEAKSPHEKYSLRQRNKRKIPIDESLSGGYASDNSNNNHSDQVQYSPSPPARQRAKVRGAKRGTLAPAPKAKTKAAPLSKYRRKTANARERTRMREINSAFEHLRHCVPPTITCEDAQSTNEKLTKITTLRLAMKYISLLSEALTNPCVEESLLLECSLSGDHRFTTNIIENYAKLEAPATPPTLISSDRNKTNKMKTKTKCSSTKSLQRATSKGSVKKQRAPRTAKNAKSKRSAVSCSIGSSVILSPASTSSAYSSQSSYASFSSTTPSSSSDISNTSSVLNDSLNLNCMGVGTNQFEINNLVLESDGESLHLSEQCLSPLEGDNNSLYGGSSTAANAIREGFGNFDSMNLSTLENPLELSLRLLESTPPGMDVSNQNPSSCISPLVGLDTFNPFVDLLSTDFPEHSSLDMFLT